MASEYLKQKYRDVKPDAPRELTPEEKRKNWWYYNKWYILGGAVVLALLISLVWDIMGGSEPPLDFQVAYIGTGFLPDDTAAAIETALAGMGPDLNGDGQVQVKLRQYSMNPDGDPSAMAAASVQLMADLMECESYLFLLEDPEKFQSDYHALCRIDGTIPDEDDCSVDGVALKWEACPVLAGLDLGEYQYDLFGEGLTGSNQDLLAPLSIARRGLLTEKDMERQEEYTALWESLIAGAVS